MYYLETNSLRILADKILTKPLYLETCFTSILSVCELLSGIVNEKTFIQRKGILRKVYFSKIYADMDMPETKMYNAYGIHIDSHVNEKINLLGALCTASKSYKEYLYNIENSNLSEYWEFLRIYDRNSDVKFKESFQMRQNNFDYSDPNLISDFNNRWNNLNGNHELRESILSDLIVYFAESLLKPGSVVRVKDKTLKDLIDTYDHSLDIYFLCVGYFSGRKIIFKNAPGRNDYFDLYHLMYLRNKPDIIVSNDCMVLELLNKIHPKNILSINNFEAIIEK